MPIRATSAFDPKRPFVSAPKTYLIANDWKKRMSRFRIVHLAILVLTTLVTSTSFGDDQACEPITVRENSELHNQIEGSVEPDKIPSWLKYRMFMVMYDVYVNDLIQNLSREDHAILNNLRVETEYWQTIENVRFEGQIVDLCVKSSDMDTAAFAREYERIAADTNNRAGERVQQAIRALSTPGREIVEDFIENRVTPKLSFPRADAVDFALRDPDGARFNLEVMCYTQINGEPPPEVKRTMECFRQQRGIEPDSDSSNQVIAIRPNPEN